jgi:hypothetical protein
MDWKISPHPALTLRALCSHAHAMQDPAAEQIDAFIKRWEKSGGHERGAGQQFLLEFCDLFGFEKPAPPVSENELNSYTFERRVDRRKPDGASAPNWIDLYKSAHFVLETKQGVNRRRDKSDPDQPLLPDLSTAPANHSLGHGHRGSAAWDKALDRAHAQGERYIHLLPPEEGRPPFLIVCDVGHCFDIYAEFSGTGGQYEPFPTPRKRRVHLRDLHEPEVRERFRKIWTDPHSLDPSKYAAKVTREVAKALADLAKSLEKDGHDPQVTAGFLQRCLFTMFAEDVGLLPKDSLFGMLVRVKDNPAGLVTSLQTLWKDMATGSDFSLAIHDKIPHFNGGLFHDATALPLRSDQIVYLIHAAKQDWSAVEPAIFGTLLERALDPRERHKLGAHYTPRSYVERLVRPTVIDPLRAEWEAVKIAAAQLDDKGKAKEARAAVEDFHHKLAKIRVLDPACGSGNFLYVALELLKRLEAEVLDLFEALGGDRKLEMDTTIIRPGNFLGIELNPRAAAIAQLVLWIGYFQWHQRTTGKADTNDRPLLPKNNTIECRDAVLAYDEMIPRRVPETGEIMTIWDGRSTKPHPVTDKEVPDESARTVLFDYIKPRRAEWPQADYIVGNPPFIGGWKMRDALGSGYVEALWSVYDLPEKADFVMYWWAKAADLVAAKKIERFGFITTNSITQVFQRRVIESALEKCSLIFAIADHPWIDALDGAAVRIAMTVARYGNSDGVLGIVTNEHFEARAEEAQVSIDYREGLITPDLKVGVDLSSIVALEANNGVISPGVQLYGKGFVIDANERARLAATTSPETATRCLRQYLGAKDLVQQPREAFVIDFFGLAEREAETCFPAAYQHLAVYVKPERKQNKRASISEVWWRFGWERPKLREALTGLERYIVTPEVSKHRIFAFLDTETLADNMLTCIASDDAATLAILCSSIHEIWALRAGGTLEDRPRYTKARCFDPFPFPALEEGQLKQRIRDLGERLDAHRKARQAAHPELTLTGMYNVLEKLRAGEALTAKEKKIHDDGLVTILKQIHDELDEAVLEAYGWEDLQGSAGVPPASSSSPSGRDARAPLPFADLLARGGEQAEALEQALLSRLVALNYERAAEEKRGFIRWLRPDYQNPSATQEASDGHRPPLQSELPGTEACSQSKINNQQSTIVNPPAQAAWPSALSAQVSAIQKLLPTTGPDPTALAGHFGKRTKARVQQITEILKTLEGLGKL